MLINKTMVFRKAAEFFTEIYNTASSTTTSISYKTKTTWGYSSKVVKDMERSGFLVKQRDGKKNCLALTKRGIKVAEAIKKIIGVLDGA